jgi:hypothetical protein
LAFWLQITERRRPGSASADTRAHCRSWRECSAAQRWSATCRACRGRCGVRCAPGARSADQWQYTRQPRRSPSAWPRASYWVCGWMRRVAPSWRGPSSSWWRTSSRCPWTCHSAACVRYCCPSPHSWGPMARGWGSGESPRPRQDALGTPRGPPQLRD